MLRQAKPRASEHVRMLGPNRFIVLLPVNLQCVDGLGELPGPPGVAANAV